MTHTPPCTCLHDFNLLATDGCHNVEAMQEYLSGPHTCPTSPAAPPLSSSLLEPPESDLHPAPAPARTVDLDAGIYTGDDLLPNGRLAMDAVKAILDDPGHRVRDPHSLAVCFRHSGWQGDRVRIFEALHRTNQPFARQENFEHCGAHAHVLQSVQDPSVYRVAGSGCHDRFCLPCANERSRAIALNVLEIIDRHTIRFLTLTVKSDAEPLAQLLHKLYDSFQKLRRTKLWKKCVTGGVAFLEINWSVDRQRWHPHLHILLEGSYLPYRQLRNLWLSITGDSFVIEITLVRDHAQASAYVTKYASKPFNRTFVAIPQRLDEAIVALKGRKLVVTFGSWRGITLARTPTEGAWKKVGSLQHYIEKAATGDSHAKALLSSLTDLNLESLYARAPPLPPTQPDRTILDPQATWFGVWLNDGTWRNTDDA